MYVVTMPYIALFISKSKNGNTRTEVPAKQTRKQIQTNQRQHSHEEQIKNLHLRSLPSLVGVIRGLVYGGVSFSTPLLLDLLSVFGNN
jgi:hypothetical protein